MATFKVIKKGWVHPENLIIGPDDIPLGRSVAECIQKGLIVPHDGRYVEPADIDDAAGWMARCDALEADIKALRTASADAESLARLKDLEAENSAMVAEIKRLEGVVASLSSSVVPLAQFQDVNAELQSLRVAHDDLEKRYGALATQQAQVSVPEETASASDDAPASDKK